jgi:glycosyltransferase involved in cell wall biosynthesis
MTTPLRLIWITPKWPLPADDGAKVATVQLLSGLSKLGVEIDLLSMVEAANESGVDVNETLRSLGLRSAKVLVSRKPARFFDYLKNFLKRPTLPLAFGSYATPAYSRAVTESVKTLIQTENPPRLILYDGLHTAVHGWSKDGFQPGSFGLPIVYRAHNREALIWERKSKLESNPLLKILFHFQAKFIGKFEDSLSRHANLVAPVSQDEGSLFREISPLSQVEVVPIGMDFPVRPGLRTGLRKEPFLFFLGRLDWAPNREGLTWFLEKVWPRLHELRPDLSLKIAGSGNGAWLSKYLDSSRIQFLGRVENLSPLYDEALACLVPVFYGGGTRVKVIEASKFGRPCVSTALGVEGSELREGTEYLRAESVEEWISTLENLDPSTANAVGEAAFERMKATFHSANIAGQFANALRLSSAGGAHD